MKKIKVLKNLGGLKVTFYHGSPIKGLNVLMPKITSYKKPYIFFATNEVVATFYMVHPVKKPYGWYSYGFDKESKIPVYFEYYPNALKDVHFHKTGYLYECDDIPNAGNPTKINCAYVCEQPIKIDRYAVVNDVYEKLLEYEESGKLIIRRYNTLTEKQRENCRKMIRNEIMKYDLLHKTNDCYADFLKSRFPIIWDSTLKEFLK